MADMKLIVAGAAGRMGRTLVRIVHESDGCILAGGIEPDGSAALGQDLGALAGIGPLGVTVSSDPLELVTNADGILDFTAPEASVSLAALAAQARIVHVIGTTGFSPDDDARIEAAARHAVIVRSGNMSLGVNLLAALVKQVAATLDERFDIEITEMHHRHKVDAPSGTALLLGEAAAQGRGVTLAEKSDRGRDGHTGARKTGDIGFVSLRGGTVIGEHSVIFAGQSERIELTHRAESRDIFALGGVRAALWGRGAKPGLYSMKDVLGL